MQYVDSVWGSKLYLFKEGKLTIGKLKSSAVPFYHSWFVKGVFPRRNRLRLQLYLLSCNNSHTRWCVWNHISVVMVRVSTSSVIDRGCKPRSSQSRV